MSVIERVDELEEIWNASRSDRPKHIRDPRVWNREHREIGLCGALPTQPMRIPIWEVPHECICKTCARIARDTWPGWGGL